ncbi:MAG TPA: GIY-YIG nuclease family protein [Methanoregulaceae archaeon]|nr:GIY-YIG nuclease family protein [Methanoregulaceae archaeon]
MDKGVYCLVLANESCRIPVGALGTIGFSRGWHVYTGSALGPGGLLRVSRHFRLSSTWIGKKRWHIDYLLTDPGFSLRYAVCARTTGPLECVLAEAVGGKPVPHFGCSDCHCRSHLFYFDTDPLERVIDCFDSVGLAPGIATINTVER